MSAQIEIGRFDYSYADEEGGGTYYDQTAKAGYHAAYSGSGETQQVAANPSIERQPYGNNQEQDAMYPASDLQVQEATKLHIEPQYANDQDYYGTYPETAVQPQDASKVSQISSRSASRPQPAIDKPSQHANNHWNSTLHYYSYDAAQLQHDTSLPNVNKDYPASSQPVTAPQSAIETQSPCGKTHWTANRQSSFCGVSAHNISMTVQPPLGIQNGRHRLNRVADETAARIFCTICGGSTPGESVFCKYCGHRIKSHPTSDTSSTRSSRSIGDTDSLVDATTLSSQNEIILVPNPIAKPTRSFPQNLENCSNDELLAQIMTRFTHNADFRRKLLSMIQKETGYENNFWRSSSTESHMVSSDFGHTQAQSFPEVIAPQPTQAPAPAPAPSIVDPDDDISFSNASFRKKRAELEEESSTSPAESKATPKKLTQKPTSSYFRLSSVLNSFPTFNLWKPSTIIKADLGNKLTLIYDPVLKKYVSPNAPCDTPTPLPSSSFTNMASPPPPMSISPATFTPQSYASAPPSASTPPAPQRRNLPNVPNQTTIPETFTNTVSCAPPQIHRQSTAPVAAANSRRRGKSRYVDVFKPESPSTFSTPSFKPPPSTATNFITF
ncbi:hypothetical protein HDU97_010289 [Phlyctochytrium planicorne]|nr:hypothetical protein HDU97_010289 [Phlyctochytrium planicorne]